jgi:hypothetical protein
LLCIKSIASIKTLIKILGLLPLKETGSGKLERNLFDLKFLGWTLINNLLNVIVFYSIWKYYDFQSIGPSEIAKVYFYLMVLGASYLLMNIVALVAKDIGMMAVDLKYKVYY